MKKLAMLAMLISTQATANSELQNLMYFPGEGTFWGQTTLNRFSDSYETQTRSNKIKQSEVDESFWTLRQSLAYGLNPNFELGMDLGFLFGGSVETKTVSTNSTTEKKYSGLEDITFNGRVRLFDQREFGLIVDVFGAISPSLSDDKEATTTTDGNAQRGGHQIVMGGKAGSSVENFSWSAALAFIYTGERTEQNAQTEVEQGSYDSVMDINLTLRGQLEFDPLTFGAKVAFTQFGSTDYTLKSTGAKTNYDSYSAFTLGVDSSMALLDNVVGFGGLDYSFVGDRGFKASNTDYDIADRNQMILQIGAKYSF